jgi:pyruvate-ferredoxin/flavodoxin oxidoreductase
MEEQRLAVACGHRILYRYNPTLRKEGKSPLIIDSKITMPLKDFYLRENRFASLQNTDKEKFDRLCQEAEKANKDKYTLLEKLQ